MWHLLKQIDAEGGRPEPRRIEDSLFAKNKKMKMTIKNEKRRKISKNILLMIYYIINDLFYLLACARGTLS